MDYSVKKLVKNENLEKKIKNICSFNKSRCEIKQGRIIDIDNVNVSFIEPHRIIIRGKNYKLLIIYYDDKNIFLYDRSMPLSIKQLESLLKELNS